MKKMRTLLKGHLSRAPRPLYVKAQWNAVFFNGGMPNTQILVLGTPFFLPHSTAEYILVSETTLYAKRLREFIAKVDWEHLGE